MTTTSQPSAPEYLDLPEPEDVDPTRHVRRRLALGGAVVAPIGFVLSNVLLPHLPTKTAQVVPKLPPVIDRLLTAHLLYALASLLFVPFVLVVWRNPARRGAALRLTGGLLLLVGMVSNALGEVTSGYLAWSAVTTNVDQAAQIRMLDRLDNSAAALPISFLAIPVAILGMLLLAIGVLRSRALPAWAPWTLIAGLVLSAAPSSGVLGLLGLVFAVGAAATAILSDRLGGSS